MKHIYFLCTCLLLMSAGSLSAATADPLEGVCGRRAQYNQDSTNLRWKVDTTAHTLTITGKGRMRDYDTDTKAPWYPWRNYIYQAIFRNGMTTVGSYAMYQLGKLTDIQWGNTETIIYNYAFYGCSSLPQLIFPASLTSICSFAFWQCSSLKSVQMGDKVKTVGQCAFWFCSNIETVDFGNSPATIDVQAFKPASSLVTIKSKRIKYIGGSAFDGCKNLINLQLGDSLERIDDLAFQNCNSLQSVHFPATLTYQDFFPTSFKYCYALDKITVDPANPKYDSRNNCNAVIRTADSTLVFGCAKTIIPAETKHIGANAFYSCIRLESLHLPENIISIGEQAFRGCLHLSSVYLPNSVTSIDCEIFLGCDALKTPVYNTTYFVFLPTDYEGTYTIPGTPKKVACGAFENCKKITSVQIPNSVTAVNGNAFMNCISLYLQPLPNELTFLGSSAFNGCSSLSSIIIPKGINTIYASTFKGCSTLPSIIIPDAVTRIDESAFANCTSLKSITFPAELNYFGRQILESCKNLKDIIWNVRQYSSFNTDPTYDPFSGIRGQITDFTFGDSVRIIPANLCYNMTKLSAVSLGANIEKIGDNTFYGCKGIKSVHWNIRAYPDPQIYTQSAFYTLHDSITTFTFGDSVRHIPAYLCHSMNRLRQLRIPKNVSSIGKYAFRYVSALDSISVDKNNTDYDSRNDCNALMETSSDVLLLGCYKTQIPDDISGVGECAFRNVRKLNTVELPQTATFVGSEAFNGCHDLKDLTLSENIETIDDYAFQDCDSLTVITLPADLKQIGLRAFANCTQLQAVVVNATTPPTIDATSFSNTTCPFQVPCAAIPTYRKTPVWSDFGSRITGQAVFTLTVEQNDYGAGKTTIVQQPNCERNAIVEAEPERGYYFAGWQDKSGNELSTNMRYEFTLEEDLTIIAIFLRKVQGLDEVLQDNTAVWYDIMGHRITTPTASGVYVVQQGNETFKVVIP